MDIRGRGQRRSSRRAADQEPGWRSCGASALQYTGAPQAYGCVQAPSRGAPAGGGHCVAPASTDAARGAHPSRSCLFSRIISLSFLFSFSLLHGLSLPLSLSLSLSLFLSLCLSVSLSISVSVSGSVSLLLSPSLSLSLYLSLSPLSPAVRRVLRRSARQALLLVVLAASAPQPPGAGAAGAESDTRPYDVYVHGRPEFVEAHRELGLPGKYLATLFLELTRQQVVWGASLSAHVACLCPLHAACVARTTCRWATGAQLT